MDYFKAVVKEDATHELRDGKLVKIETPQVVDLSGLVGNKEILFEFSDSSGNSQWYYEAYLYSITSGDHPFIHGIKRQDRLIAGMGSDQIRFQTDRWYPWLGGECPLPEGVRIEAVTIERFEKPARGPAQFFRWDFGNALDDIIAYRIIGLANGWIMPGENNS